MIRFSFNVLKITKTIHDLHKYDGISTLNNKQGNYTDDDNADLVKPINSLLVFSKLDLRLRIDHGLKSHAYCIVRTCTIDLHLSLKDILPAGNRNIRVSEYLYLVSKWLTSVD